ncbi:MAG TPA: hypothetical protein VFZ61_05975 [Polyangiales bacterium]
MLLLTACSAHLRGEGEPDGDGIDPPDSGHVSQDAGGSGAVGPGVQCGDEQSQDAGTPPVAECEDYSVEVDAAIANVLIVLDRSGSMRDLLVNRWDPSVAAIEQLTASLPPDMRLGLATFPGDCNALPSVNEQLDCVARQGSLLGDLSCEPGQIKVAPGLGTASAIHDQLQAMAPTGATPTAASLRAAHMALKGMASATSAEVVLLVTDGAPNCSAGNQGGLGSVGIGIGTAASGQAAAIPQTVMQIEAMAADGIKTYVLGYDTQTDPALKQALDRMAQAGGTGDQQHHSVDGQATLLAALQATAAKTASCELMLKSRVVDPWKVRVTLDGKPLTVDTADGYKLDTDGDNLTLLGSTCRAVQESASKHVLRVEAVCPPPPPNPPTPPDPPGNDHDAGQDAGVPDDEPPTADAGGPALLFGVSCVDAGDPPPRDPPDAGVSEPPPPPPLH